MSFIENIEIKNFKSIRHQKIEGCKKINVFIGYPNVGKSNLLEALSIFSINQPNINLTSLVRFERLSTLFYNGWINNACEIILNHTYRNSISYGVNRPRFSFQFDRNKIGFQTIDESIMGRNDSEIKRFELAADGMIHEFWSEGRKEPVNGIKKYEFSKGIKLDNVDSGPLKAPFGENIFTIISTNENLYNEIQELFTDYNLELLFDSREQKFTILKRTGTGIFSIPYELVADTLRRVIFYKAAISSNKSTTLLFEEPEAHMFPPYTRKFTADVMFDETNQFFIATHSPYILDTFMADAQDDLAIYLVYYDEGETKIKRMEREDIDEVKQYGVDLFYNLESYLKDGKIDNA